MHKNAQHVLLEGTKTKRAKVLPVKLVRRQKMECTQTKKGWQLASFVKKERTKRGMEDKHVSTFVRQEHMLLAKVKNYVTIASIVPVIHLQVWWANLDAPIQTVAIVPDARKASMLTPTRRLEKRHANFAQQENIIQTRDK